MTTNQNFTFRDLLHPLTPEVFFADYFGKKSVHIPGDDGKFAGIFSWDECNRILDMTPLWTGSSVKMALDGRNLEPEEFCRRGRNREGHPALLPDADQVTRHLQQGATLVLDLIEMLTPGLSQVTEALQMATATLTSCNAYCSWQEHPGFNSHFDTMDVFALHVEGSKTWRVYEGRFENAAEFPGFNFSSFTPEYTEHHKGALLHEVTMTPGDLLYLPRGQYHDALASSEATLHVSFGLTQPTGLDFINILVRSLPEDSLFREALPTHDQPDAHRAYLKRLADRLHEIISDPAMSEQMRDDQRRRAFGRLPGFALPRREPVRHFRVLGRGARLTRRGADWLLSTARAEETLDADTAKMAEWALGRDGFSDRALEEAFTGDDSGRILGALENLSRIGLIEQV